MRVTRVLALFAALLLPSLASAATLGLSPANISVVAGQTVTLNVYVSTPGEAVNAVSGTLSFPADLLSVTSVSKTGSILSLWVQDPTYSNGAGTVDWSGVVPNPGYSGSSGKVLSVQLRARQSGAATVSFVSSSVLANDGQGTNVLTATTPATITIGEDASAPTPASSPAVPSASAPVITSPTHPQQNSWYKEQKVRFLWDGTDTTAVRLGYGESPTTAAQVLYDPPVNDKELTLADGVTYFAVQERTADGWGPTARYKVQIDSVPPEPFTIAIVKAGNAAAPAADSAEASFGTTDALSGIDHYEMAIDGGVPATVPASGAGAPYALRAAQAGTSTVVVTAFDRAGNSSSAQEMFYATGSLVHAPFLGISRADLINLGWLLLNYISFGLVIVGAVLGVIFGIWYLWHRAHIYRRKVLRHIVRTDKELYAEFAALYRGVEDEIERFKKEASARELTAHEKATQRRLSSLLGKVRAAMDEQHLHL